VNISEDYTGCPILIKPWNIAKHWKKIQKVCSGTCTDRGRDKLSMHNRVISHAQCCHLNTNFYYFQMGWRFKTL